MTRIETGAAIGALMLNAAIFGFFYAWVCSSMWGLDRVDPRTAIEAMNGINKAVRNAVFMPAFFLTPFALLGVGLLTRRNGHAWLWWVAAALVYALGGLALTVTFNVPMNEALARISPPETKAAAQTIWDDYSPRWQFYNLVRTVFSGIALALGLVGLVRLARS